MPLIPILLFLGTLLLAIGVIFALGAQAIGVA
jgi:hypothetical protein